MAEQERQIAWLWEGHHRKYFLRNKQTNKQKLQIPFFVLYHMAENTTTVLTHTHTPLQPLKQLAKISLEIRKLQVLVSFRQCREDNAHDATGPGSEQYSPYSKEIRSSQCKTKNETKKA